jgi:hypothetical protein
MDCPQRAQNRLDAGTCSPQRLQGEGGVTAWASKRLIEGQATQQRTGIRGEHTRYRHALALQGFLCELEDNRGAWRGLPVSIGSKILRAGIALLAVGALALQGGAAWGALWVMENQQNIKDQLVAYQFDTPENIADYIESAGLSQEGALYLKASLPRVVPVYEFDRYCTRNEPGIGVLGCYKIRDSRIYLYDVTDPRLESIEPVVAAHEMLHAVWFRMSTSERDALAPLLEEAFAGLGPDHQLVERIASYEANEPASRIPELYAIIGTEIRNIPRALEAHYSRYFADRSRVVDLADQVYLVFDTLQAELQRLSNELQSRNAEIEGLRYTYEETNRILNSDILNFNERSRTPPTDSSPSRSQFEAERAVLIERQARLKSMRETLQTKIAEYNTLLKELTVLNDEVSELNQGINVTLEAEEQLSAPPTEVEN